MVGIKRAIKGKGWLYKVNCCCECGNTTDQIYADLKTGKVVSCGCYQKEKASITGSNVGMYNSQRNVNRWIYYKNDKIITMRSCYELMFADILDARDVIWEYEPKLFKLKDGMRYRPDFMVGDEWFEVKGYFSQASKTKTDEFISQGNKLTIITLSDIEAENPIKYKKYKNKYRCE